MTLWVNQLYFVRPGFGVTLNKSGLVRPYERTPDQVRELHTDTAVHHNCVQLIFTTYQILLSIAREMIILSIQVKTQYEKNATKRPLTNPIIPF